MEKKKFTDFYEAYHFVSRHPANHIERKSCSPYQNDFFKCLYIEVVKVNPNNVSESGGGTMEFKATKKHLNTKTEVWLEYGAVYYDEKRRQKDYERDVDLDCGGDSFESAIIKLANLVYENPYYSEMIQK